MSNNKTHDVLLEMVLKSQTMNYHQILNELFELERADDIELYAGTYSLSDAIQRNDIEQAHFYFFDKVTKEGYQFYINRMGSKLERDKWIFEKKHRRLFSRNHLSNHYFDGKDHRSGSYYKNKKKKSFRLFDYWSNKRIKLIELQSEVIQHCFKEQNTLKDSKLYNDLRKLVKEKGHEVQVEIGKAFGKPKSTPIYMTVVLRNKNGEIIEFDEVPGVFEGTYLTASLKIADLKKRKNIVKYSWENDAEFLQDLNWLMNCLNRKHDGNYIYIKS